MNELALSAAIRLNPRTEPLFSEVVKPEGIELRCSNLEASELYWRQLEFEEFDVSDLSFSSLVIAKAHGIDSWVALPIFTQRHFFHAGVLVREAAGIAAPTDLAGKRVGVPEYQQTGALWIRGIFQHEFGLDPRDVHWFMERPPEKSHGGATGFTPPPGIDLQYIPTSTNLGEMLQSGELDAAIMYTPGNNLVDRSRARFGPGSGVRRLFAPRVESSRYYEKTGLFPMNAAVVIRRDVLESYPWVALNLYSAFIKAKEVARERARGDLQALLEAGVADDTTRKAIEHDLYPYGTIANRELLETALLYSFEQGLTPRKLSLEELFYPAVLEL